MATSLAGLPAVGALPQAYSLTTSGWITPTKNQGNLGSCWAFGSTTAFQSSLLRQGIVTSTTAAALQLSLWHLATKNGSSNPSYVPDAQGEYTNWGADNNATLSYVTRGSGSWSNPATSGTNGVGGGFILVADDPLDAYPLQAAADGENLAPYVPPTRQPLAPFRLAGSIEHRFTGTGAPGADSAYRDRIKQAIFDHGAVAGTYYVPDAEAPYYNPGTFTFQYSGTATAANHLVAFAGWDDTKVVTNQAGDVLGTGAWLVQNSWGTGWGDGGYFWLGYGDQLAVKDAASYIAGTAELSPGRLLAAERLQNGIYAPEDGVAIGNGVGTPTWAATKLTAPAGGVSLAALGLWVATDGAGFSWSVRNALSSGTSGILAMGTVTAAREGYLEVPLPAELAVSGSSAIYVVLDYGSGFGKPVGIDTRSLTLVDGGTFNGVSWTSSDGVSWTDTTTLASDAGLVFAKGLVAVPEPSAGLLAGCTVAWWLVRGRRRADPA